MREGMERNCGREEAEVLTGRGCGEAEGTSGKRLTKIPTMIRRKTKAKNSQRRSKVRLNLKRKERITIPLESRRLLQ